MNEITMKVALEVAHHEAVIRQAYKDSEGVWTWSVGLTSNSGHRVERYIGKPQPMGYCLAVWIWAMAKYANTVSDVMGSDLPENVFAAALSFHWNTGAIRRASWVRAFKAGDMRNAERRFMLYRNPPEIIGRRKAEADLLFRGKWSNTGEMLEFTRLTRRNTPDWSSGRKFDARPILRPIMEEAK